MHRRFQTSNPVRLLSENDSKETIQRVAINEHELATRWNLSVKTLRRWRQESLGPIFCKMGARVVYLITDVEKFEKRVSRNSTSSRAYP